LRGGRRGHNVGFTHDTLERPSRCFDPVDWLIVWAGRQNAQNFVNPGILKQPFPWSHKLANPEFVSHGVCSSSLDRLFWDGPPDVETTVSLVLTFQRMQHRRSGHSGSHSSLTPIKKPGATLLLTRVQR
jgi:hypothetical protein